MMEQQPRPTLESLVLAVGPGDRDRADRLAEETLDVAAPTDATVVLLHVFTESEFDDAVDNLGFDESPAADEVAGRHATVRTIAEALDAAGVDYEVRGAVGDHGENIVAVAEDVGADRVLVGGRKRSPTGKAVFGSTAQEVLLSSPAPVTFVRADTE